MELAKDPKEAIWSRISLGLLLLCLGLALWPVWANAFFLTNDGPCHLYNARILRDMLLGTDTAFYREWFVLNPEIEPNWLNHLLLVIFQMVLPAVVAEKLFLSLYILGFALAFRYLSRSVYKENEAFLMLALPFLFHRVFHWGFFNFSASVVLFFLVVGYWLRTRDRQTWKARIVLGSLMLLLLLAHPVSYAMAMGLIAAQWLGESIAMLLRQDRSVAMKQLLLRAGSTALAALPSILLMLNFLRSQQGVTVPGNYKLHTLFHHFLELECLILFDKSERLWPMVLAIVIGALFLYGFTRLRKRAPLYEGILLIGLLSGYAYFNQPAQVAGVGIVPERLQFYPYLFVLCWLVTLPWPRWTLRVATLSGALVAIVLFGMRLPHFQQTSEAVTELVSAKDHMRPYTTLLTLNYAPEGRLPNNGPVMSQVAFIFMHATEYIGAMQPHIIFNNYEANTQWFPLRWVNGRDPYQQLADGPGFEGWLPTADFEKFERETGKQVDYVLQWCLDDDLRANDGLVPMLTRLEKDYQEIYISAGKRVRLWEHRP